MRLSAIMIIGALFLLTSCDPSDRHKKLNGSSDTTATFKAGSGKQPDTNAINEQRKSLRKDTMNGDTNGNGNAYPSGSAAKSNQ